MNKEEIIKRFDKVEQFAEESVNHIVQLMRDNHNLEHEAAKTEALAMQTVCDIANPDNPAKPLHSNEAARKAAQLGMLSEMGVYQEIKKKLSNNEATIYYHKQIFAIYMKSMSFLTALASTEQ